MRIALLTTDNREHQRTYEETTPRFGPAIESVLDGLSRQPDLEIHVIACTQRPMAAPEKLSENTWFHLLDVPKIGWLRTGYQGCVRAIRRKLRELQPDLVHGEGTERECALSAAISGFPNVVTIHGNMGEMAKTLRAPIGSYLWSAALLEAYTLRRADGVFCNSAYTERVVQRRNLRTWRVPNAIRAAFFEPLPARGATGKALILNIGVIGPRKRQLEILALAAQLHPRNLPFEFRFIGDANPKDVYVKKFLERIEAAERLGFARYLGPKNLNELIDSIDASSALIHAPAEEAFGLVVAEALARNLKFFGTNIGGVPDVVAGAEAAELFSLQQPEAMAAAIQKWLDDGAARPKGAAQQMRHLYHPNVIAQQHLDVYRDLLDRK